MTVRIDIKNLPKAVNNLSESLTRAQHKGLVSAALSGVSWLKMAVMQVQGRPPFPPFDVGTFRNGWMFESTDFGARIYNQTPHAPFIVGGVRPDSVKPGKRMISALTEWVLRKQIAGDSKEASSIAYAIGNKMRKTGIFMDPQFRFVARVVEYLNDEVPKQVAAELKRAGWKV